MYASLLLPEQTFKLYSKDNENIYKKSSYLHIINIIFIIIMIAFIIGYKNKLWYKTSKSYFFFLTYGKYPNNFNLVDISAWSFFTYINIGNNNYTKDYIFIFLLFALLQLSHTLYRLYVWFNKNNVIKDYIWSTSFNCYLY